MVLLSFYIHVREKIRTPDLLIRSQTLYPAELRALTRDFTAATYRIIQRVNL